MKKKHTQQAYFPNYQTIIVTKINNFLPTAYWEITQKTCFWPHSGLLLTANTHAEVQLPSVPPLSLPSEEHIIIIIIDIIQRPTPVFQAKLKQSETVSMLFTEGSKDSSVCRGNTCHVHLGAVQSCEWLNWGIECCLLRWRGRLVNTAARHYGGQTGATSSTTYSPPNMRDVRMGAEVKRSKVSGGWYGAWGRCWRMRAS